MSIRKTIKHLTKISYFYANTKTTNKKLNNFVLFSLKKKTIYAKRSLQLCLIRNKLMPFFENLPNNKKINPFFYSNAIRLFGFLKSVGQNCGEKTTVIAGKWVHGILRKKTDAKQNKYFLNEALFFTKTIHMLIVTDANLCALAVKEANAEKIVSFGCINFGYKNTTDITYFVIGPKNNVEFFKNFCLVMSYMIKWKHYLYACTKKEQEKSYIKHKKYIKWLKKKQKKEEVCDSKAESFIQWTDGPSYAKKKKKKKHT